MYASVINNKLVLSGQVTGAANTIAVTSDHTLAADLGMTQTLTANDAAYTINGQPKTSASNIVSNGLAGVTLTLNGTTVERRDPGGERARAEHEHDHERDPGLRDRLQLDDRPDLRATSNDPKVANPTTDAQREAGMLQGDPQLLSILSNLRQSVSTTMSGATNGMGYLGSVGLSTGAAVGTGTISQDSLEGKLTLDTTKLDLRAREQLQRREGALHERDRARTRPRASPSG